MSGRNRVHISNAEKQKAYRQRQKNVTKFKDQSIRNGEVDRIGITRVLREGCVNLSDSAITGDLWFVRTENFPGESALRGWYDNETEKRKWQRHLNAHIQSLLDPLGVKYSIFPSGRLFESCLVIAINLKIDA